jgi:hypothetical protein
VLTGPALEIQQKMNALAGQVKDDQAAVDGLDQATATWRNAHVSKSLFGRDSSPRGAN